ncbi:hypothetical protein [Pseudonocardia sp. KRD291]|uniref:hypothetical protein n=1 Tax=Pseudonocardia sp. KRD291 TaxID=2792007 RepID=UPI001C49D93F|nr:hypothetical protein [Pseudonocardia sp. KRD291]MBW0105241.1 hypothetical protein [Pseudonocardia sp. KRD291]
MTAVPDLMPSSTVWVGMHVYDNTSLGTKIYPADDRATVEATGSGGSVTLFLGRPEIARLRGVLEQAEHDLTEHQNAIGVRATSDPAA